MERKAPRARNDALCSSGVARFRGFLNHAAVSHWLNDKIRHVLFDFVISGGQHQVSGKSLRVETKHDVHFRPTLDRDALTYSGSLGK